MKCLALKLNKPTNEKIVTLIKSGQEKRSAQLSIAVLVQLSEFFVHLWTILCSSLQNGMWSYWYSFLLWWNHQRSWFLWRITFKVFKWENLLTVFNVTHLYSTNYEDPWMEHMSFEYLYITLWSFRVSRIFLGYSCYGAVAKEYRMLFNRLLGSFNLIGCGLYKHWRWRVPRQAL